MNDNIEVVAHEDESTAALLAKLAAPVEGEGEATSEEAKVFIAEDAASTVH